MVDIPNQPDWVTKIADTNMFIGMVANEWNKMEYGMAFVAAPLMGSAAPIARITLYAMNPPARRDYLYALLTELPWKGSPIAAKVTKYVDEFERLRKLRNDIVHGRWNFAVNADADTATAMLTVLKGRAEPKEVTTPEQTVTIMRAINDIQALNSQSHSLGDELRSLAEAMRR
jgi:hypothetical protein